jgi:hypothetical protein
MEATDVSSLLQHVDADVTPTHGVLSALHHSRHPPHPRIPHIIIPTHSATSPAPLDRLARAVSSATSPARYPVSQRIHRLDRTMTYPTAPADFPRALCGRRNPANAPVKGPPRMCPTWRRALSRYPRSSGNAAQRSAAWLTAGEMIHGMQGVLGAPDGVAVPSARAFALEGVRAASRRSGMRPDRLGGGWRWW